ncbi:MAG: class I SAM-dependent methyltransferase [Rudaea sp.]
MKSFTSELPQDKRRFYSRSEIAKAYDEQRFGGDSGAWVNRREIELALGLLPPFKCALDLACGTGRLTQPLAERGPATGLDASRAMLEESRHLHSAPLVQGDAFSLPFAPGSFDAVLALRLAFHFPSVDSLLSEAARVLAPGGSLIFDTYLWTPRALLPLDRARWGGGVFAHSAAQVEQAVRRVGLNIADRSFCFLFSPYLYKRLPLAAVKRLARIEERVPEGMRARVFWRLVQPAGAGHSAAALAEEQR